MLFENGVWGNGVLVSIGVVKAVFFANGVFAWVKPAIFIGCEGLRSKAPCFCGENVKSPFSTFCQHGLSHLFFGGCQKGGFPKGGFWRMFPRNEGTPRTKTGTRVHSLKPPFYETALLSPFEFSARNKNTVFPKHCFHNPDRWWCIF